MHGSRVAHAMYVSPLTQFLLSDPGHSCNARMHLLLWYACTTTALCKLAKPPVHAGRTKLSHALLTLQPRGLCITLETGT